MKLLISSVIGSLILVSVPALARDSSHLVCSGYMQSQPDPDNYGFAVLFDESRANDGESRNESLSSVWQGKLFTGSRINKQDDFGANGTITMANTAKSSEVFYKGKYSIVENKTTGKYSLKLNGIMNIDPSAKTPLKSTISTTLDCVDISN